MDFSRDSDSVDAAVAAAIDGYVPALFDGDAYPLVVAEMRRLVGWFGGAVVGERRVVDVRGSTSLTLSSTPATTSTGSKHGPTSIPTIPTPNTNCWPYPTPNKTTSARTSPKKSSANSNKTETPHERAGLLKTTTQACDQPTESV